MGTLDKILEIAAKASAALNIIAPGSGGIATAGVAFAKFIAKTINDARAPGIAEIVLPANDVLIARLEATATRIVETGEGFLAGPV